MKRMMNIFVVATFCVLSLQAATSTRFVIITPSYNNQNWYTKNLESVFNQDYPRHLWRMIYIDDCSPDSTGKAVAEFVAQAGMQDNVTLVCNRTRKGALENIYNGVTSCESDEVVVLLDGDDAFNGADVLSYLATIYADESVWMTYGQFVEWPSGKHGFCCDMPEEVVRTRGFRQSGILPSHLRTFYAGLFHKIDKADLVDTEGHFYMMAWDVAIMVPMIEMACDNFKFLDKVLYEYNGTNPLSDHRLSRWLQLHIEGVIRKKPAYAKLETLF